MGLRSLNLPKVLSTSGSDIIADFFVPCLRESARYDRGVGYFSASWLRIAARGMADFAKRSGYARWLTSPILSRPDWEALLLGERARRSEVLQAAIEMTLDQLESSMERDCRATLSWLVADGILDFKLAVPRGKLEFGEFHDKFGVFTDNNGDHVSFNGSYNDSIQGTLNYESIKIFCDWEPAGKELVASDSNRFHQLWSNRDPNVEVYDLPKAAVSRIVKLRSSRRPYPAPDWSKHSLARRQAASSSFCYIGIPSDIELRGYQTTAIDSWFAQDCRGFFEMATGTGKTITSLGAAAKLHKRLGRLALVIAVPFKHLVDQWHAEVIRFGFAPLRAYGSRRDWLDTMADQIVSFTHGAQDTLCVIATHDSFSSEHFGETLARIGGPVLLIADEAHHLGSQRARNCLPEHVDYRLALSATPDRWHDEAGTASLRAYFGPTAYELSLADAIGSSLTPYYYYPVLVELCDDEMEEYAALSCRIGQLLGQGLGFDDEQLTRLLFRRANLLNTAKNKVEVLRGLVADQSDMHHTLFYCAPRQIDSVVQMLGQERGVLVHRFTARESTDERQDLLRRFQSGSLQALVAMHCLDEGVDVPSTETAYLLASSGNPRQFIQRRGRVLRRFPGKDTAAIYDLITVPSAESHAGDEDAEKAILRRELARFKEFADSAINAQAAYDVIWRLASDRGVLDF